MFSSNREDPFREKRLSLLERLSSSIAHEIKNPLFIIKGILELAQEDSLDSGDVKTITQEIERVDKIILEYLNLSRPFESKTEEVDFNQIVQDISFLIRAYAKHNGKTVEIRLSPNPLPVLCDTIQIKCILLELIEQTIRGMGGKEKLEIETSLAPEDKASLVIRGDEKTNFLLPLVKN